MVVNRVRRAADSGVATAVASVIQHQKFKKMLMFGIRSLSDFCNPSSQLCVENSLDALNRNVVPSVVTAVSNFCDDEDLILCSSQILSSMACGCVEESGNQEIAKKLLSDGGLTAIEKILSSCPTDETTIGNCYAFIESLSTLNCIPNGGVGVVPCIFKSLENSQALSVTVVGKAVSYICFVAKTPVGLTSIKDNDGVRILLTVCQSLSTEPAATSIVENALKAVCLVADAKQLGEDCLDAVISLIEKHKHSKVVLNRGSDIIKSVVSTAKLQKSLSDLQSCAAGTPEHKAAVSALRSLSYISSVAKELAEAGAISLIIDLINKAAPQLVAGSAEMAEVICGASRIIAGASSDSKHGEEVIRCGGVETLVTTLSSCAEHPSCVISISDALTNLLHCGGDPFVKTNAIGIALPLLYQLSENEDVASSMMNLMFAASKLSELESSFTTNQVIEVLCTCCQYHVGNLPYQMNTMQVVKRFAGYVSDLSTVYSYGGLSGITSSLSYHHKNEQFCTETLDVLLTFASIPGSQRYMTEGDFTVTDAIMELMLEHDSEIVIKLAIKVLEIVATEDQVKKTISELKQALAKYKDDVEGVYRKLAAVTGLYRIARLRQAIVACGILPEIMKGISSWIQGGHFEGRTKLTRAALQTTLLVGADENECQSMISGVTDLACFPQVKRLIELEDPEDNFLMHCTNALCKLCAIERSYTQQQCSSTVECINKVMRKYSDIRQAEICCMEAFMNFFQVTGKMGLDELLSSGALVNVVGYLSKVPMYLQCQTVGISFLLACAKMDQSAVECLKNCNCLQLLRVINRTHTRNRKLKAMVGLLLTMLIPSDAVETELSQLLSDIESSMASKDFLGVHTALTSINQLLVSKEVVRIAARLNIGEYVTKTHKWVKENSSLADKVPILETGDLTGKDLVDSTLFEFVQITHNMCQTRIGLVYLTKTKLSLVDLEIFESLKGPLTSHVEDTAVTSLDTLTTLFLHDRANIEDALKHNMLEKIYRSFALFTDSPAVIRSICKCLAAICNTPSRIDALISTAEFVELTKKLVGTLSEDNVGIKCNSLKALSELLKIRDEKLLEYFSKKVDLIPALFETIEMHPDNAKLVELSTECLGYFGKDRLLKNTQSLGAIFGYITHALNTNKNSAPTVLGLLNLLVTLASPETKDLLRQSGAVETVSDVMMVHSDVDEIMQVGGVLFGLLGAECQIRALMRNVIDVVKLKESTMAQQVDKLCSRLAMYLLSPMENRLEALADTELFLASLNTCMAFSADNQNLMVSTSTVSRRLCDSAFDDSEDQFGAWAIANSSNLQQIIAILGTDYGTSNVKFLSNAYRIFTGCVVNTYVTELMQSEAKAIMPGTLQLLDRYKANADVIHSILEFLRYLAMSPKTDSLPAGSGGKMVLSVCKEQNVDILANVTELMINHKGSDAVVIPAMQLIGEFVRGGLIEQELSSGAILDAAERVCMGDVSEERKLAYINLVTSFADGKCLKDSRVVKNVLMLFSSSAVDHKSPDVLKSVSAFVTAVAGAGFIDDLSRLGAVSKLLEMLDECPKVDAESLISVLNAIRACVVARPDGSAALLKDSLPKILEDNADVIVSDERCGEALCDMLLDAMKTKGVGLALDGIRPLKSVLTQLIEFAKKEQKPELEKKISQVFDAIASDRPLKKSCQTVYSSLEARKIQEKSLNLKEVPELVDDANFLLETMEEYNHKVLSSEKEDGNDHIYGSMAFELLCSLPDNCIYLIEHDILALELKTLSKQRDFKILNGVASVLCCGCLYTNFAVKLLSIKNTVSVIGTYLSNVHNEKNLVFPSKEDGSESYQEAILINALLLVERTAINRKVYLSSDVVSTLIRVWDAYDAGKYKNTRLLRQTFKSLRKVIAEGHLDLMLRCNMVSRIKDIFYTSDDNTLISDALFLAGSMAIVQTIRSQICEVGLIDSIVNLMNRHVGNPGSPNAIITNTCLALANACIGHRPSSDRFLQLKGPELNVTVLRLYRSAYDVINGASILLCNMLYKNDHLKEMYGKIGAPKALVDCLHAFAGSSEALAIRCIESLFKAISNLGLYASNVSFFLEAGIEQSFQVWLDELDVNFSDQKLKTGLQTLSNLVTDNKEESMEKFAVTLPAVLKVLSQERSDSEVALLSFDVLSSLSRLPANSVKFMELGGVELVMQTMRRLSYDSEVITLGVHLLGAQTSSPNGIAKLLEMDIFSLLLSTLVFDGVGSEVIDLLVASLRCMRKLITSSEMVYLLCSQDGLSILIGVSMKHQSQPTILVECFRLLLGMLAFTGPNVESEPAAWENIGMEKSDIESVLKVVCISTSMECCMKMSRFQRISISVLAYFLSCGHGAEVLVVNGFGFLVDNFLSTFGGNLELVTLAIVLLENSFTVPQDVRNNLISKDVLKRLRDVLNHIPNKKPEEKALKARCQKLLDALTGYGGVKLESTGKFDFSLSEWNVDPYPNGTHDLPEAVKQALRKGERLKAFIKDNPVRVGIKWRSSQDLNCLEWGPEDEDYPYRVSIRRIRNIARGLKHPSLELANSKEPRKVNAGNCFCIFGSATEDFPDGLVIPIKCKSAKERDATVELLVQWRDAASYNH